MRLDQLSKFIEPLKRRVMLMVGRAVIKASEDSGDLQLLQLLINAGEVRSAVQRLQEYGFSSRPLDGAEAAVVFLGGNRDHGVVVAVDDRRYRIKSLAKGEVAIYTDEGDKIHLKRGNKIEIETGELTINAATKVEITTGQATITADQAAVTAPQINLVASSQITANTPLLAVSGLVTASGFGAGGATPAAGKMKITGDIEATGAVQDQNGTMQEMRTVYNSHTHNENNVSAGPTNGPNQAMT